MKPDTCRLRRLRTCLATLLAAGGLSASPVVLAQSTDDRVEDGVVADESFDPESFTASAFEARIEEIRALRDRPLDLNASSAEELDRIPSLTPLLAARLVAFRAVYGPFERVEDIRAVRGITARVYEECAPFLTVPGGSAAHGSASARPVRTSLMHRIDRRLDLGTGYRTASVSGGYLGSPYRVVTRLRGAYGDRVRLGFTGEKDPGEPWSWHPENRTYGYDHGSAYVAITGGKTRSWRLVGGDFRIDAGQGLLAGGGYSMGKTGGVAGGSFRRGTGPAPYGSSAETGFFRGAAARLRWSDAWHGWTFVSRRRLDASTTSSGPTGPDSTRTVRSTGLHRTAAERTGRRALRETAAGGSIAWQRGSTTLAATGLGLRYDPPLSGGDRADQRFRFRGSEALLSSLSAETVRSDLHLFTEIARSPSGSIGALAGGRFDLAPEVDLAVHFRRYPADFWSPHGGAFAEQGGPPNNEEGLYVGLTLRPDADWEIRGYVDQFRFPWLRYGVSRPSTGEEAYLRVAHRPGEDGELLLQLRSKLRETGSTIRNGPLLVRSLVSERRQTVRLQATRMLNPTVRLRIRIEGARGRRGDEPTSLGVAGFPDLRWTPGRTIRVDLRRTWFRTDDYESRVYQLESDLYYAFSAPALSGRGRRTYAVVSWALRSGLRLEAKYASVRRRDRDRLGSGLEELAGNRRREARVQVRWTSSW